MKMDWLFDVPVAHRGLHDDQRPENSMPAFQNAIDHGLNIEIDVHVLTDGNVVVFHDDNLKRVCGVDKKVKECDLEEIKTYSLLGTEYRIPTLEEFLALVDGKVGVLCEIKGLSPLDHSIVKATIDKIVSLGYKGNFAIQSFNYGAVKYAREHTDLPCGQLLTWHGPGANGKNRSHLVDFMGKMWIARLSKPHFIAYDVRAMDKRFPENKHVVKWNKRLPFLFWTVNSEEKTDIALKYANNVIFEKLDPEYVKEKMKSRRVFDQQ